MSIINQALQKAQREQLRHSQQEMPYRLPVQRTRASRRRWLLAPLGLVAAVGVGAILHAWFLTPMGHVPVPTEIAATSSPLVIPIPPATPLPVTPGAQAGIEPALPGSNENPLPVVSEPPPLAPVGVSADTTLMPTDSTLPPTVPAAGVWRPEGVPASLAGLFFLQAAGVSGRDHSSFPCTTTSESSKWRTSPAATPTTAACSARTQTGAPSIGDSCLSCVSSVMFGLTGVIGAETPAAVRRKPAGRRG